jgi:hypothetical protein
MSATLSAATIRGSEVELKWRDGAPGLKLPLLWLRDNCQCDESRHPQTRQRLVDTFRIPPDISASAIELEQDGRVLRLEWDGGGHVSRFDAGFLSELRADPDVLRQHRRGGSAGALQRVPAG